MSIFAPYPYSHQPTAERAVGVDGKPKPRWNLTPIMLGAAAAQLVGIGVNIWKQGWLGVWIGGVQVMVVALTVMTWRLWDFTSRQPGTGAYDMRYGTDTVTEAARARPCPECARRAAADDEDVASPSEVRAEAIRAAVEETGDPYARPEDGLS